MASSITHKFVSAIPDGPDNTVVQPSDWNDAHDISGLQETLVSGTNIKTVNGASILGAGDLAFATGLIDYTSPVTISNTATTLTIGKHHIITETGADRTMTLPAASGNAGKGISIQITGSTTKLITIDGNASEAIDGALTRIMWANETATLLCDGSNWFKIAGKSIAMTVTLGQNSSPSLTANTDLLLFDTLYYSNCPAAFYSTANKKITALRPGEIQFDALITYNSGGSQSTDVQCRLWIDGSFGSTISPFSIQPYITGVYVTPSFSGRVNATAGQYYQMYAYHRAGTGFAIFGNTALGAYGNLFTGTEILSW